jgi:hypothetical protein
VWFGGGKLAADLTLPKLRCRWAGSTAGAQAGAGGLTAQERSAIWEHAARTAAQAAGQIRSLTAAGDPAAAADAAWAAGDTLHAAAAALRSRVVRQAAAAYDRAARARYGRIPSPTPAGNSLRRVARLLSAAAFTGQDRTLAQIAFIARLAALAEAVSELRDAQQHAAQAAAARRAAERLHAARTGGDFAQDSQQAATVAQLAREGFPAMPRPRRPAATAPGTRRPGTPVVPSRRGPPQPGRRGPAR